MSSTGSQHHERYEQMKAEVNRRRVDWWLYRSNKKEVPDELKRIIELLKTQFLEVGPFGHTFVKESPTALKPEFYGIPLQHDFTQEQVSQFTGIAYTATNGDLSILLRTIFDYLRTPYGKEAFEELEFTLVAVSRADNKAGKSMVISMECVEKLKPLSFYEHPSNGRLLLAMENADPPEHSALSFYGNLRQPRVHVHDALDKATKIYNEYELDNVSLPQLLTSLYSIYAD